MEIREVTTYNEKAPFTGYGLWIVFELKYRKILIVHPVTLTEIVLSEYEYVKSCGDSLWPINTSKTSFKFDKFARDFKERIRYRITKGKSFPIQTVAKVIAELDNITVEEASRYLTSLSHQSYDLGNVETLDIDDENREYRLRKGVDYSHITGRPLAIIEAFRENGPSSKYKITELVTGKVKTKMKISRVVTYFVNKLASQGILEIVA
jgi:hypothetical protein